MNVTETSRKIIEKKDGYKTLFQLVFKRWNGYEQNLCSTENTSRLHGY